MKKLLCILVLYPLSLLVSQAQSDSTMFHAYIINKEYDVYLRINLYDNDIKVPGQELYGELPGFLGKNHNSFCWLITDADVKDNTATLSMINDYGSEDLTASLTAKNDSTYVLKQLQGSTLKVPKNGKWQKLPKVLEFKKK